jgi:hypothetical protein
MVKRPLVWFPLIFSAGWNNRFNQKKWLISVLRHLFRLYEVPFSLPVLFCSEFHRRIWWKKFNNGALYYCIRYTCSIAFAKPSDGRPVKYAFVRVAGILVNIGLTFCFYRSSKMAASNPKAYLLYSITKILAFLTLLLPRWFSRLLPCFYSGKNLLRSNGISINHSERNDDYSLPCWSLVLEAWSMKLSTELLVGGRPWRPL